MELLMEAGIGLRAKAGGLAVFGGRPSPAAVARGARAWDRRPVAEHVAPPLVPDSAPGSLRVQVLATEHWSLLATRTMLWNESFARTGMFLTVVSASVVGLAIVGQAADFGDDFRAFALLLRPLVLALGLGTFLRVSDINDEEKILVAGMNRLRYAYLALAPDLKPYFVTGHHDDEAGIVRTYSAF